MKLSEALEKLASYQTGRLTRYGWPYDLSFGFEGYLMIGKEHNDLTPYCISKFDFDCDWSLI
jgi:hypothetical protein